MALEVNAPVDCSLTVEPEMQYEKHLHTHQLLYQRIPLLVSLPETNEVFPWLHRVTSRILSFLDHLWNHAKTRTKGMLVLRETLTEQKTA